MLRERTVVQIIVWWSVFLFQAEDGIRDLVRSRGLGDVYKRQARIRGSNRLSFEVTERRTEPEPAMVSPGIQTTDPVSYTHLTLPTSDLV